MKTTLEIIDLDQEVCSLGPLLALMQASHVVAIFPIEDLDGAKKAAESRALMMGSPVALYEVHMRFAADGTVSSTHSDADGWTVVGNVIPPDPGAIRWE